MGNMGNPRYANGQLRRRHRARLRAMGGECGICHGRFGPIHYDEPSDCRIPERLHNGYAERSKS